MKLTRRFVQVGFVALTLIAVFVVQGNAEKWCPFGGVEALYTYAVEGNMLCSLAVSNFYILAAVLVSVLLLRRAFCGYACPIGAISEWIQGGANRLGIKPARVPHKLDRALSKLKYVVLIVILGFTWYYAELEFRAADPCYALLSRHGEDITIWAYIISGAIVVASVFIVMPFCRWFCPFAAVMNPFSRFGLTRIKRSDHACTNCGLCARVCPTAIPVDKVDEVKSARCMSCLNCVDACPLDKQGALTWGPPKRLGKTWPQAALISIFLVCVAGAVATAYALPIPSYVNRVEDRGPKPEQTATLDLRVSGVACRGSANLFVWFLDRDDIYEVPGYLRVEAWPGPGTVPVKIMYDPSVADEEMIKQALVEPYFNGEEWFHSDFTIEGYDPYGLFEEDDEDSEPVASEP